MEELEICPDNAEVLAGWGFHQSEAPLPEGFIVKRDPNTGQIVSIQPPE